MRLHCHKGKSDRKERLALASTTGIVCGFVYGLIRGACFRHTLYFPVSGIRSLSNYEYILIGIYLCCFYILLGFVLGTFFGMVYLIWNGLRKKHALKRIAFWQFLLWGGIFLKLWCWLNLVRLLGYWGAKVRVGSWLLRAGFVSAKVWIYNSLLIIFAAGGFLISYFVFKRLIRRSGVMTPAIRALCFSWIVTVGGYFFCVIEINNALPSFFSLTSLNGNTILIAGFAIFGWVNFRVTRHLIENMGLPVLYSALTRSRRAVLLRRGLVIASLSGLFLFFVVEQNIPLKYMIYLKGDKIMGKSIKVANLLLDFDRDGYSWISLIKDSHPLDERRNVLAVDFPFNGVDEDGYGGDSRDADGDGFERENDCDDEDDRIYPGALELPNDRDDNCDGIVDNIHPGVFPLEASSLIMHARQLSKENRLLILIVCPDSLRADHVGFMGYHRDTTPTLDKISRQAIIFRRAYSPGPGTSISIPSLFLSVPPCQHRLMYYDTWGSPRKVTIPSLVGVMRMKGYYTAFLASHRLSGERLMLQRGFNVWRDAEFFQKSEVPAPQMIEGLFHVLQEAPNGNVLLFIHFWEPHLCHYDIPSPYDKKFGSLPGRFTFFSPTEEDLEYMKLGYDRRLAFLDSELAKLLNYLKRTGKWEDTLLIFTSDHGEEFGEHGALFHLSSLYDEQVHVPLMIRFPAQRERRVISQPVQTMDVMPTILEVIGLDGPASMRGRSLLPLVVRGDDIELHNYIFLENTTWGRDVFKLGLVHRDYKYIFDFYTGEEFLFDLADDPQEKRNLSKQMTAVRNRLRKVLFNHKSAEEKRYRDCPVSVKADGV